MDRYMQGDFTPIPGMAKGRGKVGEMTPEVAQAELDRLRGTAPKQKQQGPEILSPAVLAARQEQYQAGQAQGAPGVQPPQQALLPRVPSIDDLVADLRGPNQLRGWETPEERASAARLQLEMMKLAGASQAEQAKLEASRNDLTSRREFEASEGEKQRQNQLAIAELQTGARDDVVTKVMPKLLEQALNETGGNYQLASKLVQDRSAEMKKGRDSAKGSSPPVPATSPAPAGPAASPPAVDNEKINTLLKTLSGGEGQYGGLDRYNSMLDATIARGVSDQESQSLADYVAQARSAPAGYDPVKELAKVMAYNRMKSGDYFRGQDLEGTGVKLGTSGIPSGFVEPMNQITIPGYGDLPLETAYRPTRWDMGWTTEQSEKQASSRARVAAEMLKRIMAQRQQQQGK